MAIVLDKLVHNIIFYVLSEFEKGKTSNKTIG